MDNSLINIIKNEPIGDSCTTGTKLYSSFIASSGFNYQIGMRETSELYIYECFAEGVGCSYLNSIMVFFGEQRLLIADIRLPQGTYYSREVAMNTTKNALCKYVFDACKKEGIPFSKEDIESHISKLLDKCYFESSRKAIMQWATNIGLIN